MFWTEQNVRRIIIDFIQKITPDLSKRGYDELFELKDLQYNFGLSSMQIVELSAYINSFFHLFDVQKPPNLLKEILIDGWVNKILIARKEKDKHISFKSSGTSGNAKLITHSIDSLNSEIIFLKTIIQRPERIISLVPANHIYGFLFTIVLPNSWNIPVVNMNQIDSLVFNQSDLIVATPFSWHYIHESLNRKTINARGISSGAPLNDQLYLSLTKSGFHITEIYGSSETAGVGWRVNPNKPFTLFSYWEFIGNDKIYRKYDCTEFPLMDHLIKLDKKCFNVQSRIDQVVQVGGVNVNLESIKRKIESIETVKKATIYAKASLSGTIIAASIELFVNSDSVKDNCMNEIYQKLELLEVPKHIVFFES